MTNYILGITCATFLTMSAYYGHQLVEASQPLPITVIQEPDFDFVRSLVTCLNNEYISDESCDVMHYGE